MATARRSDRTVRPIQERAEREGWSLRRTIARISAVNGVSPSAAQRMARTWTLRETAARLNALRAHPGGETQRPVTIQMLCAWEQGRVVPSLANVELLCRLYDSTPAELGYIDYPRADDDPSTQLTRRDLMAGYLTPTSEVLSALSSLRREADESANAEQTASDDVQSWQEKVASHCLAYFRTGSTERFGAVVADFVTLHEVMRGLRPRLPTSVTREGDRALGQLAGLTGLALIDFGRNEEGTSWFATGRRFATKVGDQKLQSWILARDANAHVILGQPRKALRYAQTARRSAGPPWSSGALLSSDVTARALAQLGRHDEALSALRRIEEAFEPIGSARGETIAGYYEGSLHWTAGRVHAYRGDKSAALAELDAAMAHTPRSNRRAHAVLALGRATALAMAGDIAGACELATMAILALPDPSRRALEETFGRELLRMLPAAAQNTRSVRDLRALIIR